MSSPCAIDLAYPSGWASTAWMAKSVSSLLLAGDTGPPARSLCTSGACQMKLPGAVRCLIGSFGQTAASAPTGLITAQSANEDTRPQR